MKLTEREVRALRDDDQGGAHLALAERLRAMGDVTRAEYVSLACAVEGQPLDTPERAEAVHRLVKSGLVAFQDEALEELHLGRRQAIFQRGFVTGVALTPSGIASTFASLDRRTPLRHLSLVASAPKRARNSPAWRLERALGLPETDEDEDEDDDVLPAEAIASAPWMASVSSLEINAAAVAASCSVDAFARDLASSPVLRTIRRLTLRAGGGAVFGPASLASLLRSRGLDALEEIYLEGNGAGASMVDLLTERARTAPTPLRALGLGREKLGDEGLTALARSDFFPSLLELLISWNDLSARSVHEIMATSGSALRSLHLNGNKVGDEGALSIARSERFLASARSLGIGWADVGDEGAKALVQAFAAAQSRAAPGVRLRLDLQGNPISPRTRSALLEARETGLVLLVDEHDLGPALGTLRLATPPYVVFDDGHLETVEEYVCEGFEDGARVHGLRDLNKEVWRLVRHPGSTARVIERLVRLGFFREGAPDASTSWREALVDYFHDADRGPARGAIEGYVEHDAIDLMSRDEVESLVHTVLPDASIVEAPGAALAIMNAGHTERVDEPIVGEVIAALNALLARSATSRRFYPADAHGGGLESYLLLDETDARWLGLA